MEREPGHEDGFTSSFEDAVRKALETTREERGRRVMELRRQVEEGCYHIPLEDVARKLLEAGLMELLDY